MILYQYGVHKRVRRCLLPSLNPAAWLSLLPNSTYLWHASRCHHVWARSVFVGSVACDVSSQGCMLILLLLLMLALVTVRDMDALKPVHPASLQQCCACALTMPLASPTSAGAA